MPNNNILMFIDYLIIPFIALGIDLKRSKGDMKFSLAAFLRYVSYTTVLVILTFLVRAVISRLGIGLNTEPGSDMYTIIAAVLALIIPYIREILATYVNVRCEIKGKKDPSSDE